MNIENIINKFNYDEDLANFLRKLYPEFINYFGLDKEPIIYEALYNTPIVIGDNVYQILKDNDMLDEGDGYVVTSADLKRASGVYKSIPILTFENNEFKITDVKRIVALIKDFQGNFYKQTLIHELGHLIKSYYNEYKIDKDLLINRSGLIETQEKLLIKDGIIKTKLLKETSVGLEEALNSLMEEELTKKIVDPNYKVSVYKTICDLVKIITEGTDLLTDILNAQVIDNKEELINIIDNKFIDGAYDRLNNIFDKLYILILKQYGEIFNKEKLNLTSMEIKRVIKEEFNKLIDEINNKENIRKEM